MSDILATISFRANMLVRCGQYSTNAKQIINCWTELNTAAKTLSLKVDLVELLQSARLSGLVTAVETLLNDTLIDVLVAYPPKLGKKQVLIQELNEAASYLVTIKRVARKTVNDLSYGTIKDYLDEWQKQVTRLSAISEDQIMTFAEIKATRDLYVHSSGKTNEIYERKAGSKARETNNRGKLPLDEGYMSVATQLAEDFVNAISIEIASKYSHCTKEAVFREMWDATCCGELVAFDKKWEITRRPYHRKDFRWGWSSSEKALFDIFLRIFHRTSSDISTDIEYALYRWPADTDEGVVIRSWIEHPFYL
jgi:hypothetical protein